MGADDWLGERFEAERARLRAVAFRMLGSWAEADDAVQEAWLRLSRQDADSVDNLGGWLTTVVGRICLDMLRSRRARREEPLREPSPDLPPGPEGDPEREALQADAVGLALLVVLETLTPAERVAFVLHDLFDLSFDEVAVVVDRTPVAARQLASRARRRVRAAAGTRQPDPARKREIVDAFLAASRRGDFEALLNLLDPAAVVRADQAAAAMGGSHELRGSDTVARFFSGRARGAQAATFAGDPGAVWAPGGRIRVAFVFTVDAGSITEIRLIADAETLAGLSARTITST
jgi:RNA polymerase sigma factor (sigma-70 family)